MKYEVSFIGAGNMAEAIARGVLSAKTIDAADMMAADVSPERRAYFERELKIRCVPPDSSGVADAATVVLSVKPQHMAAALENLSANITDYSMILSIAAGISTSFIEQRLPAAKYGGWRIVRAMPNTPMLVGEGMVAIARGGKAGELEMSAARKLFESAAEVIEVPEAMIDAVTAVSGSGPAYFFFLVEQMIGAATQLGLSDEHARKLATRTAAGAAKMLATSSDEPKELRRKVTSPGGTTEAAINHMTQNNWPQITIDAIKAAERRGKELGK